jgi:alkylated DNA repair dioxygenase AlkB
LDEAGFVLVPDLIEPAFRTLLWTYVAEKVARGLAHLGDRVGPKTPVLHADPMFEGLLAKLRAQISEIAGRNLTATYSYVRVYRNGDVLRRHRDRSACEYSVSLNVGQLPDRTWPLHLQTKDGPKAVELRPGDAVVFKGIDCDHWREAFEGERLVQAFFHYVDADGPYADLPKPARPAGARRPLLPS